jgi:hypothetical protein
LDELFIKVAGAAYIVSAHNVDVVDKHTAFDIDKYLILMRYRYLKSQGDDADETDDKKTASDGAVESRWSDRD